MKSIFSKNSQRVGVAVTCHTCQDLAAPVPGQVYVVLARNNTEIDHTRAADCTGKGNCTWDQTLNFDVTMYTDDKDVLKEKKLSVKVKDQKNDVTIAKGEVDITPLLNRDGSLKKIKLELLSKKGDQSIGLTVSFKPTWHDDIKEGDNMSEMSEVAETLSDDESAAPDLNVTHAMTPKRAGGHRRSRSQSSFKEGMVSGVRGEPIQGGIQRGRSESKQFESSDQVEDLKMQIKVLEQRLDYAEQDARDSRDLLDQRTRVLQDADQAQASNAQLEKLTDENEELRTKVASLQSILEVSCIGQEVGVVNKDDWIESLEMSLIHAKTEIATLKEEHDKLLGKKHRGPVPALAEDHSTARSTPTGRSRPGHRRTHSRGEMQR
eukprot:TRINITY_DN27071_c0_g1_i2.p1 TRINITY_DN27071_c0_g1~~TRINITY_DN27071_c0_g1_i2.p1  ORF type:complete len:378 (+),score=98.19 TRINITY_DN27071_c0_g1_i2:116-1249(+)